MVSFEKNSGFQKTILRSNWPIQQCLRFQTGVLKIVCIRIRNRKTKFEIRFRVSNSKMLSFKNLLAPEFTMY